MGRKSKLKKQRKAKKSAEKEAGLPPLPEKKGDIETLNWLGYGKHNQLRSPDVPVDRPEPQL
ncbi:hypothetical protein Lepto7376_4330 [[Leptolyngbya] sp. PCC 7376]|uniref:hypothetical protein n=1 Tax=[Leptolyngbya] sp. PCC 7376 TaxID=111781 RepID=UPI00029F10C5|nr:hypothetical protein [[Leptolyngbya] sp. PCC 7376]AFY40438.1 hypothetical protein Lepto7376_4330 [[Leptolyngbya] sp. PCC 7376]